MRKLSYFLGTLLITGAATMSAATVQCQDVAGATVTSPTDILFTYNIWSTPGFACEQQDKIYSNFSPGAIPTDATLRITLQTIGANEFHTVNFGGSFTTDFVVGYTITLDKAVSPNLAIVGVTGDIQNPAATGSPQNVKVVTGPGEFTGSLTSTTGSPGTTIVVPNLTTLDVTDTYTAGGGAATNIANTFQQGPVGTVPEPATMMLLGAGLIGLAAVTRRRRAS